MNWIVRAAKSPAGWGRALVVLYVKEITLLNLLVVVNMVVPAALIDPLAMLSGLS
jgi:hypothetical protein